MKIEIYSRENCRFCDLAKKYFNEKELTYTEIKIDADSRQSLVDRVVSKTGIEPRTVPQIFIDDEYVGGYDDLIKLY